MDTETPPGRVAGLTDEMHADRALCDALGVVERAWTRYRYSYNFTWLGLPIIQVPQDITAIQEIIWRTRPRRVVETGVAHGGSLALSASIMRLAGEGGRVMGIDIDIRAHNRAAIEAHPLGRDITLVEGSSIDPDVVARARAFAAEGPTMVILDSNHTHDHVLAELRAYAPLVTPGLYCCVMDTIVERVPGDSYPDRPWHVGNNPMTAVDAYLAESDVFAIDESYDRKLGLSMAPRGYLRRATGERSPTGSAHPAP